MQAALQGTAHGTVDELAQQLALLSEKYHSLQTVNNSLTSQAQAATVLQAQMRELQNSHSRLEKAHTVQATYMQKMQQENQKVMVYQVSWWHLDY